VAGSSERVAIGCIGAMVAIAIALAIVVVELLL